MNKSSSICLLDIQVKKTHEQSHGGVRKLMAVLSERYKIERIVSIQTILKAMGLEDVTKK